MALDYHKKLLFEGEALKNSDIAALRRLVAEMGVNPNDLLRRACKLSSPEACKELVALGASVRAVKKRLFGTALHDAVAAGRVEICRALVEAGADPLFSHVHRSMKSVSLRDERRLSPFMQAVRDGREEIVRYFVLECGVDPLAVRTDSGRSPLQISTRAFQPLFRSIKTEAYLWGRILGVVGLAVQSGGAIEAMRKLTAGVL
jgi:ankyrin repeat protein